MAKADLLFQPLTELGRMLRSGETSPVELTELSLARLESIGRELNAVAALTRDVAYAQARQAERELKEGRDRGPLHGIPYGAKDLFDTAGITTTNGARPFAKRVPTQDATVVTRLREAGAVLVAKLSMAELAGGLGYHFGTASLQGPMRNPWDPERWAGGSSSGSAAAVGAGLVPFALGTETWGSITCPSAFCGVTGLRPTYGRVSRHGAMALSWTLDKIGPLTRSAADCRLVLDAIAGHDPLDDTSIATPIDWDGVELGARGMKAALVRVDFAKFGEPEVEQRFEEALAVLKRLGVTLVEAKLPDEPFETAAWVTVQAEAVAAFEPLFENSSVRELEDERAPLQREVAKAITAADYVRALRLRRQAQRAMNRFFDDYDVIVTPNQLKVAPGVREDFDNFFAGGDAVGGMGNACGLPALALPMGLGRDGMPCGFQVIAPAFEEAQAVRLGLDYQRETRWHLARPKA